MMQTRFVRGVLLGLAALILMPMVPAIASIATDLLSLKILASNRLSGGTLERAQEKAVEALQKKILRVEQTDAGRETAKYLARAAKVIQAVEKVEAKGVDLGEGATPLLASLVAEVSVHEQVAVAARDLLLVSKDWKVVDRQVIRGRAQLTAAEGQATDTKRAKKYARAAKAFLAGTVRGKKLLDKEIEKGIIAFEVVGTSLDTNPVLGPDGTIDVEFNLPPAFDSLGGQFVQIQERRPGDPAGPGEAFSTVAEAGESPTDVVFRTDVPLAPGTWFLVIAGLDSEFQDGVRSADYPIVLETTLVVEFTIAEE